MASSLLNLVHNLAERILKIQYKNEHNSMKYKTCGIKYNEISLQEKVKCTVQISTQNTARSFGQFGQIVECSFKN